MPKEAEQEDESQGREYQGANSAIDDGTKCRQECGRQQQFGQVNCKVCVEWRDLKRIRRLGIASLDKQTSLTPHSALFPWITLK